MQNDRIRTILVPTDFSNEARDAAAFARDLAEQTAAAQDEAAVLPGTESFKDFGLRAFAQLAWSGGERPGTHRQDADRCRDLGFDPEQHRLGGHRGAAST